MKKEKFDLQTFGENLVYFRKLKKLSQEVLAEQVGVSRQMVSNWENGNNFPTFEKVIEICKVLNITIEELTNRKTKNKNPHILFSHNKILFIIKSIFLVLVLLYFIVCFRKYLIMNNIQNNINNYKNLSTYSYTVSTINELINSNQIEPKYTNVLEIYFKNNVLKMVNTSNPFSEEQDIGIIFADYNNNIGYSLDPEPLTKSNINLSVATFPKENGLYSLAKSARINILECFNPFYHIKIINNTYLITYTTTYLDKTIKIEERIDKSSGIILSRYEYYDDKILITNYENSINNISNTDVEIKNLNDYTSVD